MENEVEDAGNRERKSVSRRMLRKSEQGIENGRNPD